MFGSLELWEKKIEITLGAPVNDDAFLDRSWVSEVVAAANLDAEEPE